MVEGRLGTRIEERGVWDGYASEEKDEDGDCGFGVVKGGICVSWLGVESSRCCDLSWYDVQTPLVNSR